MTGRAACSDMTPASGRAKPRARATVSVAPLRETPGARAHACARPSRSASRSVASARRRVRAPSASAAASATAPPRQAARDGGRAPEPPRDRPLEGEPGDGGRQRAEREPARTGAVERAQLRDDLRAQADEQRRERARVQRDLEALAQLGIERRVRPAQQPRDERDVRRRGDRQQLGGPVQQPERDRVACPQAGGVSARRHRRRARRARPSRRRRPRRRGGSARRSR